MEEESPGKRNAAGQDNKLRRDATSVVARGYVEAKTPTNSTSVRGLDYKNSLEQLSILKKLSSPPTFLIAWQSIVVTCISTVCAWC